jgi:hypothetical protein
LKQTQKLRPTRTSTKSTNKNHHHNGHNKQGNDHEIAVQARGQQQEEAAIPYSGSYCCEEASSTRNKEEKVSIMERDGNRFSIFKTANDVRGSFFLNNNCLTILFSLSTIYTIHTGCHWSL